MSQAQTSAAAPTAPAAPTTPTATPDPKAPPAQATPPKEAPAADDRALKEAASFAAKARKLDRELSEARKALEEAKAKELSPEKRAELLRTKPWDALMQMFPGMSKADITRALLGAGKKADPIDETKTELQKLRDELAAEKRAREERETQGRAHAVLSHCLATAKAGGEKYELVRFEMERDPQAWTQALLNYEKKYPEHDAERALADFEALLLQRERSRASLAKVRALYARDESDQKTREKPVAEKPAGGPRTLTKDLASTRAAPATASTSGLADRVREEEARMEAATAAFRKARTGG